MADPNAARRPKSLAGKEIRFSHSGAKTFAACNSRWWFQKHLGLREPSTQANLDGLAIHLLLEIWVLRGIWLKPGTHKDGRDDVLVTHDHIRRAQNAAAGSPLPGQGQAEQWVENLVAYDGVLGQMRFAGAIDWNMVATAADAPDLKWLPEEFHGFEGLIVEDYKTKKYRDGSYGPMTSDELQRDTQGRLYGYGASKMNGLSGDVLFLHNNIFRVGNPAHQLVGAIMPWQDIEATWEAQAPIAAQMIETSRITTQDDVPANLGYCNSFGRLCPFASKCVARNRSAGSMFSALTSFDTARTKKDESMSFFANLKAKHENAAPTPETPSPAAQERTAAMAAAEAAHAEKAAEIEKEATIAAQVAAFKANLEAEETAKVTIAPASTIVRSGQLQPDDTMAHDSNKVSQAFVVEVVEICQTMAAEMGPAFGNDNITDVLRAEGLPMDWRPNIVALLGRPDASPTLKGFERSELLRTPADVLVSLQGDDLTLRAQALAKMPTARLKEMLVVAQIPALVLAQEYATGATATLIRSFLLDIDAVEFPFEDEPRRILWLMHQGSIELTDEAVSTLMKAAGEWTRLNRKKAQEIIAEVVAAPKLSGGETPADEPIEPTKTSVPLTPENTSSATPEVSEPKQEVSTSPESNKAILKALRDATTINALEKAVDSVFGEGVGGGTFVALRSAMKSRERDIVTRAATLARTQAQTGDSDAPTLYAGCYIEGARHIGEWDVLQDICKAVNARIHRDLAEPTDAMFVRWFGFSDYADTGSARVAAMLQTHVVENGLPEGKWWFERGSVYNKVGLADLFRSDGGNVIAQRS
jgi:hypothetical protein